MLEVNKLNIDEKELKLMWRSIQSDLVRNVIKKMGKNRAFSYMELSGILNEKKRLSKSITSYYIRKMQNSRFLKKENNRYFLTRHGLEMLKIIKTFERKCMKFDISDCDADGRIEMIVRRN